MARRPWHMVRASSSQGNLTSYVSFFRGQSRAPHAKTAHSPPLSLVAWSGSMSRALSLRHGALSLALHAMAGTACGECHLTGISFALQAAMPPISLAPRFALRHHSHEDSQPLPLAHSTHSDTAADRVVQRRLGGPAGHFKQVEGLAFGYSLPTVRWQNIDRSSSPGK